MAKFSKFQKTSVGHLFKHYERGLDSKGEPIKYSNGSIDLTKSKENYNLAKEIQPLGQKEFLDKRLSDKNLKVMKRKDVKVVCEWIITKPKDLPQEKESQFFKTCFDFLKEKYGAENIVSAWVHKDETTPHMHFAFIPVYFNEKKQEYRVSANDKIKRSDLKAFHKQLQQYCEGKMGCEVNIENGATKNGNLTVEQLKANKRLEEATAKTLQEVKEMKKVINDTLINNLTVEKQSSELLTTLDKVQDRANNIKIENIPDEIIKWVEKPTEVKFNNGIAKPYMETSIFEIIKKWITELTVLLGLKEVSETIAAAKVETQENLNKISKLNTNLNKTALSLDRLHANVAEIQKQAKKTVSREKPSKATKNTEEHD